MDLSAELLGNPYALRSRTHPLGENAIRQVLRHGLPEVTRVWREIAAECGGMPEAGELVLGASNRLNPIPAAPRRNEEARRQERDAEILASLPPPDPANRARYEAATAARLAAERAEIAALNRKLSGKEPDARAH